MRPLWLTRVQMIARASTVLSSPFAEWAVEKKQYGILGGDHHCDGDEVRTCKAPLWSQTRYGRRGIVKVRGAVWLAGHR